MIKAETIRQDFPIFENYKNEYSRDLIYLDSASSSLTPEPVLKAMDDYYRYFRSNTERSSFVLSQKASRYVASARQAVADFIETENEETIIFTSGATDAANRIVDMLMASLPEKSKILTSDLEHHSVFVSLEEKVKNSSHELVYFKLDAGGDIDYDNLEKTILEQKPGVIFVQLASNITGQVNDLARIKSIADTNSAIVVCDASQAVGHIKVSVKELNVDALFFSAHKMCGPTGVGALYIAPQLKKLSPSVFGVNAVEKVSRTEISFQENIKAFEPGTGNIAGVIGLGAAIAYLEEIGLENISEHSKYLNKYCCEKLQAIEGLTCFSASGGLGIVSFCHDKIHAHDLEFLLAEKGIALRSGFHCAESFARHLSDKPLVRISLYLYNTKSDIDNCLEAFSDIFKKFGV